MWVSHMETAFEKDQLSINWRHSQADLEIWGPEANSKMRPPLVAWAEGMNGLIFLERKMPLCHVGHVIR